MQQIRLTQGKYVFKFSLFVKKRTTKFVVLFSNAFQLWSFAAMYAACPLSIEYILSNSLWRVCERYNAAVSGKLVNAFAAWLRLRRVLTYAKHHQQTRHFHLSNRNGEVLIISKYCNFCEVWTKLCKTDHIYTERMKQNILTGIW